MSIRTIEDLKVAVTEYEETEDEYLMREIISFAVQNLCPYVYEIVTGEHYVRLVK